MQDALRSGTEKVMANASFWKNYLKYESRVSYTLYLRISASMIAHQVPECDDWIIIAKFGKDDFMTQPIDTRTGVEACTALEHETKRQKNP